MGIYGSLALVAWALVVPGFAPGPRIYAVPATVAAVSWLVGTRHWRSLGTWRSWLFVGSLVALAALAGGGQGLGLGLAMAARALAVLLAVDTLAAHVPVGEVAALAESLGLPGLGFALGVALNLLPALRRIAANVLAALRLRGGPWRRPWLTWPRTAVTILALTLARGQEIVDAAEARGYAPGRAPAAWPGWRRGDAALLAGLALWGLALALA